MSAKNNDSHLGATGHNAKASPQEAEDPNIALIRTLNDHLRQTGSGGQVLITNSVLAEGLGFSQKAMEAVAQFNSFNDANDPWQEHDCASLVVEGRRVMWKIDYYDRTLTHHSPDPADSKVTCRVLTIMLASDY